MDNPSPRLAHLEDNPAGLDFLDNITLDILSPPLPPLLLSTPQDHLTVDYPHHLLDLQLVADQPICHGLSLITDAQPIIAPTSSTVQQVLVQDNLLSPPFPISVDHLNQPITIDPTLGHDNLLASQQHQSLPQQLFPEAGTALMLDPQQEALIPDPHQELVAALLQEIQRQQQQISQQQTLIQLLHQRLYQQQQQIQQLQKANTQQVAQCLQDHPMEQQSDSVLNGLHPSPQPWTEEVAQDQVLWNQEPTPGLHIAVPQLTPTFASSMLCEPSSSTAQATHQNDQSMPKDVSSNTTSMVLGARRSNKAALGHGIGVVSNPRDRKKRPRNALSIQERLAIINYSEQHEGISITKISTKFNVPRSTVHRIIKGKDSFKRRVNSRLHRGLTLEGSNLAESRFRILEELLVAWYIDLKSRGVNVTNKTITAQAFEIHRLLSTLLSEPLKPCAFTSGWLQGFKRRRGSSLLAAHNPHSATTNEDEWFFPDEHLQDFSGDPDDIYTCGVVNMCLDKLPASTFDDSYQDPGAGRQDTPMVSVLLCYNASGTRRLQCRIIVRLRENDAAIEMMQGKAIDAGLGGLTAVELEDWLWYIDKDLIRPTLLVMDPYIWELLPYKSEVSELQEQFEILNKKWRNIRVIRVPRIHSASLPMAAGLARDFKRSYLNEILGQETKPMKGQTLMEQRLFLISHAFLTPAIPAFRIRAYFKAIVGYIRGRIQQRQGVIPFQKGIDLQLSDQAQGPISVNIDQVFSESVKNANPELPDTVLQYYLAQDNSVGPSRLLRVRIQEMQLHEDFKSCFEPPNFGTSIYYNHLVLSFAMMISLTTSAALRLSKQ